MYTYPNVVIDDERTFNSVGEVLYFRNSQEALEGLNAIRQVGDRIKSLWLDHDLGVFRGNLDTTMVIIDYLCELKFNEDPYPVDQIFVHTQNPPAGLAMMKALRRYEYNAIRAQIPD